MVLLHVDLQTDNDNMIDLGKRHTRNSTKIANMTED